MGNVLDPVDAVAVLFDRGPALRSLVVPRRDGAAGSAAESAEPLVPDPDAIAAFERAFAKVGPTADLVAGHDGTAGDLAAAIREPGFGDVATMTPQQAAAAAALVLFDPPKGFRAETLADAWIAARGVTFAAVAAVELAGFGVWYLQKGQPVPALRRTDSHTAYPHERFAIAARVRRRLTVASDTDYTAAFDAVSALRTPTLTQSTAICFLFPEDSSRYDRQIPVMRRHRHTEGHGLAAWFLLGAVTTGDQARDLAEWAWSDSLRQCPAATATAFATVGTDLIPALVVWATEWETEARIRIQRLFVGLDTDEAIRALLGMLEHRGTSEVLLEAAAQFPERGVRLLAEEMPEPAAARAAVERVLRMHVTSHPDAAHAVLPELGSAARSRVEKVLSAVEHLPLAEPETLPELLISPPWEHAREVAKPVVIKGLTSPEEAGVVWLDDAERERWAADELSGSPSDPQDWDKLLATAKTRWDADALVRIIRRGPQDKARQALEIAVDRYTTWYGAEWVPAAAVRFGPEAFPGVLSAVGWSVLNHGHLIMPFACSEAAPLAADWAVGRPKAVRSWGQSWLRRHPGVAARALIPAALGKPGKARRAAENALRFLAANSFDQEVRTAAGAHGPAAEAGIATLLVHGPLYTSLPKAMPEPPVWAEPAGLPQLLLAGREQALPPAAIRNFVLMLMISDAEEPYPGLDIVKELCDTRSLAEFCWSLFENWRTADFPSKQSFAFNALRWFGDDETVRRLSPLIRVWPGAGGHARAVTGLDVLAAIGGDTALIHLYGISQKVKFKGLKEAAQRRIAAIAEQLGLTREQLGDRLVPDLGLDDAGALELDYGPRRFSVFFDEQLKPGVEDESGKLLKALPKPGAKDDPDLAPAAYQRFSGLKKDVRTLASDQIARLELAMVSRRRWTASEFQDYLVGHPLVRHLVRRLVWADFHPDGTEVRAAFRVAEDLSYADVDDGPFPLPDDAAIGLAHPIDLGSDLPRWSEVFADYEILQPFQQLGRSVFALTAEQAQSPTLHGFGGLRIPGGKVLGLERRGWTRSDPADAGWQGYLLRALPNDLTLVIDLDPGFGAGWANQADDQEFREIWISRTRRGHTDYWRHQHDKGFPFSVLDPVTASEVLRDLTEVTAR